MLIRSRKVLRMGCIVLLGWFVSRPASAQVIGREQDIIGLRLGQRVLVDDGSCPAGQIKEVTGSQMTSQGVTRVHKCIPRLGTKKR
jgi:uncharacterized protein DUF6719